MGGFFSFFDFFLRSEGQGDGEEVLEMKERGVR